MAILFKNNASTKLASGITAAATSMSVVAGTGDLFPSPAAGEYFLCTIVDDLGNKEIVKVTAKSIDTFTIVRAQEGTTARAFNANSLVENRLTAGALNEILNVTYASAAEVAAGAESTKAVSPATLSSANVSHAVSAGTAAVCTGNAATASDMAAGHALAGATTIEEVRNRVIGGSEITTLFRDMRAGDIVMRGHATIRTLDDGLPEALELNGAVVSLATFPRLMRVWWGESQNATAPAFYRCNAAGTRDAAGTHLKLPDLRGYVPRGWDHGRGVDAGRVLLSLQEDAIRNIVGEVGYYSTGGLLHSGGYTSGVFSKGVAATGNPIGEPIAGNRLLFDASRVVPTAAENRMRNAATMFIVYV